MRQSASHSAAVLGAQVQGGQEAVGAQRGRQSTRTGSRAGGLGNGIPGCLALRIDAFDPHSLTDKSRILVSKQ